MSTAWSGLGKRRKFVAPRPATKPSQTGKAMGLESAGNIVLRLCDTMVVNDLKDEFYYTQSAVVTDAFDAHRKVVEANPQAYRLIVEKMRPIALESQKVLAALYLWDKKIDRPFAKELLADVRPTWKMTFYYALRSPPTKMGIQGGWNRTIRAMVRDLVDQTPYYHVIKYSNKLKPLVSWAHLPEDSKTTWLFKKNKRDARANLTMASKEANDYFRLAIAVREGHKDNVLKVLSEVNLPYTVAIGILGQKNTDPEALAKCVRLMTPWEAILNIRKLENANLFTKHPTARDALIAKMAPEKLKEMKVDPVELYQAYKEIKDPEIKRALATLIDHQITRISTDLAKHLQGKRVAVVFDTSGSMQDVAAWSLMLAYTISRKVPDLNLVHFNDRAYILDRSILGKDVFYAINQNLPSGGTSLGAGLMAGLNSHPDIIFFISDFEGNTEPWSPQVYSEYKKHYGKFPEVISIKFTTSPLKDMGEPAAFRQGRWLNIPEEQMITIRNLWDFPKIMNYLFDIIPEMEKNHWYLFK